MQQQWQIWTFVVGIAVVMCTTACGGLDLDTTWSELSSGEELLEPTIDVTKAGGHRSGPSYPMLTEEELSLFADPGRVSGGHRTTMLHQLLAGTKYPNWRTVDVLPRGEGGASGDTALLYFTETLEVRFTPEIQDLARKLDYDPVKIYNWVYNHIAYEPYDRSRKGGQVTYLTRRGNEWDQSSLLIALLRISGYPARYRRVRFYKKANWLVEAAYVEVWMSGEPYREEPVRGIAGPEEGIWYPLVPWLKEYEVVDPGFNAFVHDSSPTALEALDDFPEEYLATPTSESAVDVFADRLLEYIRAQDVGIDSLSQVPVRRDIVPRTSSLLPRSFPRSVEWDFTGSNGKDTSDIHDHERVWVDFRFANNAGKPTSDVVRVYLPRVAGHHVYFSVSGQLYLEIFPVGDKPKKIFMGNAKAEEFPLKLGYKSAGEDTFDPPPNKGHLFSDRPGVALSRVYPGSKIGVVVDNLSSSVEVVNRLKSGLVADMRTWGRTSVARIASFLAQDYARHVSEQGAKLLQLVHRYPNVNSRRVIFAKVEATDFHTDLTPFGWVPEVTFHVAGMPAVGSVGFPNGAHVSPPSLSESSLSDVDREKLTNLTSHIRRYMGSYAESEVIEDWIYVVATSTMAGIYQAIDQEIEVVRLTKETNLAADGRAYYSPQGSPEKRVYFDQTYGTVIGERISIRLRSPSVDWMILPTEPIVLPDGSEYLVYFGDGLGAIVLDLATQAQFNGGKGLKGALQNFFDAFFGILGPFGGSNFALPFVDGAGPIAPPEITTTLFAPAGEIFRDIEDDSGTVTIIGTGDVNLEVTAQDAFGSSVSPSIDLGLDPNGTWQVVFDIQDGKVIDIRTGSLEGSDDILGNGGEIFVSISDDPDVLDFFGAPDDNPVPTDPVSPETPEFSEYEPPQQPEEQLQEPTIPPVVTESDSIVLEQELGTVVGDRTTTETQAEGFQDRPQTVTGGAQEYSDGDPVNLVTGEFYTEEKPDLVLRSRAGLTVSVIRRYRSRVSYNGLFGHGWTWNHSETILPKPRETGPDDLVYYDAHRTPYLLTNNNNGTYSAPRGVPLKIKATPDEYRVVDARGNVRVFSRPGGALMRKQDRNGNGITFGYGLHGRLVRMRDDLGQWLRFTYNDAGKVERVTDSAGRSVAYVYDGDDLIEFWDAEQLLAKVAAEQQAEEDGEPEADGQTNEMPVLGRTQYAYYKNQDNPLNNHNMKQYTLPSGDSLEIHYYNNDRVSHHISKSNDNTPQKRFDFQYSPINQKAWTTNEKSQKRTVYWNSNLDVTKIIELDGSTEHRSYDAHHNLIQITDRAGRCTRLFYDTCHTNPLNRSNLLEVRRYLENCPKLEDDEEDTSDECPTLEDDTADSGDEDSSQESAPVQFETVTYRYYPDDYQPGAAKFTDQGATRLHRRINDAGYETTFVYDSRGNLTQQAQQLAFAAVVSPDTYQLNLTGSPVRQSSATVDGIRRHETVLEYDKWGNVMSIREQGSAGLLRTVTYSYDSLGLLLLHSTDANDNTSHYVYDPLHRIIAITDPLGHTSTRLYDAVGRVIRATDTAGETTWLAYNANGQLSKRTQPDQSEWTFEYGDARDVVTGRPLVSRVNPLGHRESYEYDRVGNVTTVIAPNGHDEDGAKTGEHQTTIDYDPLRRPIAITDAYGNATRWVYNGGDDVARRVLANGSDQTYRYDRLGRLTAVTDVLRRKTTFHYGHDPEDPKNRYYEVTDREGNLIEKLRVVRIDNPEGLTTRQEYNVRGQLVRQLQYEINQADPTMSGDMKGTREIRMDYDELGRLIRTVDGKGRSVYRSYDGNDNMILEVVTVPEVETETDATIETIKTFTVYEYDGRNQLIRHIDALGHETEYDYDRRGLLTSVTDALGFTTQTAYNSLGQPVQVTAADLATTQYIYDQAGRLTGIIDPLGEQRSVVYDKNGNAVELIDSLGHRTRYDFDALNRLLAVENAKSEVTSFTYDAMSNLTTIIDAIGHPREATFDAANRITSSTDPLGRRTHITYDDNHRAVVVHDPMEFVTTRKYNPFGELETAIDPVSTARGYDYNVVGELTQETWTPPSQPKVIEAEYTPGLFGVEDSERGGTTLVRNYDALGRLDSVTQGGERVQDFAYDALSRLTYAASYEQGNKVHEVAMEYDEVGRLVAEVQDGIRVETRYDEAGNMTNVIYPPESSGGSGKMITRQPGPGHLLDKISDSSGMVVEYDYDDLGRVDRETVKSRVSIQTDIEYDAVGRQTHRDFAWRTWNTFTPLGHVHLDYDPAGTPITKSTSHFWRDEVVDAYTYDDNDRLHRTIRTPKQGDPVTFEWQHDALGNWLLATGPGIAIELDYDYQNRIVNDPYDYDERGNLKADGINTYTYDALDQLVEVSNDAIVVRYTYDAIGRRVTESRTILAADAAREVTIRYVYHGLSVIEERINQDGETSLRSYVYGQSIDDRVMMQIDNDRFFYVKDHQQSPVMIVSASGNPLEAYEYAPYGQMTVLSGATNAPTVSDESTIGNPYGYTGRRCDAATGLCYYRNRDYHPRLGRFLQNDPAGFPDGWNRYAYVQNNPTSHVDPLGLTAQQNSRHSSELFFGPGEQFGGAGNADANFGGTRPLIGPSPEPEIQLTHSNMLSGNIVPTLEGVPMVFPGDPLRPRTEALIDLYYEEGIGLEKLSFLVHSGKIDPAEFNLPPAGNFFYEGGEAGIEDATGDLFLMQPVAAVGKNVAARLIVGNGKRIKIARLRKGEQTVLREQNGRKIVLNADERTVTKHFDTSSGTRVFDFELVEQARLERLGVPTAKIVRVDSVNHTITREFVDGRELGQVIRDGGLTDSIARQYAQIMQKIHGPNSTLTPKMQFIERMPNPASNTFFNSISGKETNFMLNSQGILIRHDPF